VTLYTAVVDFGHRRKTYYVSEYGRRVGLLLLRGDSVLLVRQYRFVAGGQTWEIPGGRIDEGESALEAAARECWEETGWRSRDVRPLTFYIPGTDIIDNPTQICVARAGRRERIAKNTETTGARWVPIRTCLDWVRRGRIVCGMTAMALFAHRALGPGRPKP
jgi:8-oxo-dGTP pyrophosphatase MutT (NUDIX family)